jgi:hypothetical protein
MASPTYADAADAIGDRMVAGIGRIEGVVAATTGAVASFAGRIRTVRRPVLFLEAHTGRRVPTVQQIAVANFAVAERVLAAQKHYTVGVLSAAARRPVPSAPRGLSARLS